MSAKTSFKKTNNKKSSNIIPRLKMASKKARMLILILIFVNYGAYFTILSYADAYSVQFILFCGSGPGECVGDVNQLDLDAGTVNVWYGVQTGQTFTRQPTILVNGERSASYYRGGSATNTATTHSRLYEELSRRGILTTTTRIVVRMGFPSMVNCGVADVPDGLLAIADPFARGGLCANIQDSVMAHELGHTILGGSHTSGGNLMAAPLACNGVVLNSCDNLTEAQKNVFRASPWFNVPYGANKAPTKSPTPSK